jgi:quercetin dioxygenase-like cupin family protein
MAYKNKIIENSSTGQTIQFIETSSQTGGELLEMESSFRAHSKEPPPHYHPYQKEDFTIVSGELTVRMDGRLWVFRNGDSFHVPINKVHSMWNASTAKTIVNWKVRPAMRTENLLEMVSGLANDGKTNQQGVPNLLQVALLANHYSDVFRVARPPYFVQKILFVVLSPIAYLFGYKPSYKKYLD